MSTTDDKAEEILQKLSARMADEAMALLCGVGAFTKPQPTALRLTPSGRLEVVELRDDGTIIEPAERCPKCGPILLCSEHACIT